MRTFEEIFEEIYSRELGLNVIDYNEDTDKYTKMITIQYAKEALDELDKIASNSKGYNSFYMEAIKKVKENLK